jgi:hypothetical protein
MRRADDPDIIGTAPDPFAGLPLAIQREAAPDVADPRPVPRAVVRGGKQAGRERVAPHLAGLRGKVYAAIVGHGPITREGIAATTAIKKDTVNGRASELLKAGLIRVASYDRTTGSALLEVVPTSTED